MCNNGYPQHKNTNESAAGPEIISFAADKTTAKKEFEAIRHFHPKWKMGLQFKREGN